MLLLNILGHRTAAHNRGFIGSKVLIVVMLKILHCCDCMLAVIGSRTKTLCGQLWVRI
jgi:hypothetical protein